MSKIKDTFNVPDNIIRPLSYLEGESSQENTLLHPTENDLYFTKKFATYDFESKLTKTTIAEIRERNFTSIINNSGSENLREEMLDLRSLENEVIDDYLDNEIVYDDDGNLISGLKFRQNHPDEDYIQENTPLSYVIAYNFGCESCEEYDFVTPGQRSDKCTIQDGQIAITRSNNDPWELISSFYKDLKDVSIIYRDINLHQTYEPLINYLKDWFYEKDLVLNIDNELDHIDDNDDVIFDDDVMMENDDNIQRFENRIVYPLNMIGEVLGREEEHDDNEMLLERNNNNGISLSQIKEDNETKVKVLYEEIKLMLELRKFLELLIVLGYNSGKYDIPLIKKYFFHEIFVKDKHPTDTDHLHIIKKGNCYTNVELTNIKEKGCYGFALKDMREFTGPGGNLRTFIRGFQTPEQRQLDDSGKSFWPYEYLDDYDLLHKDRKLPPKEAFFSSLKNENVLEEEINSYIRKHNLFHLNEDELKERSDCPPTGNDNYQMLKQLWQDKGWETLLDYLRYYNEMDVRPFLNAILVYLNALCQHCVNPLLLTCYSLPGVAKKILSGYMPPGAIHYIGDEKLFNLMKKAEVGGQSIIMTRENPVTHPYIVGYDACSLYLSSFGKDHFIGQPTFYENKGSGILEKIPISQRKFDKKRLTSKISSEYFEIIQKVDYPSQFITKEYQIKLSALERMYIQDKYDYYEIPLKAPKNFVC